MFSYQVVSLIPSGFVNQIPNQGRKRKHVFIMAFGTPYRAFGRQTTKIPTGNRQFPPCKGEANDSRK